MVERTADAPPVVLSMVVRAPGEWFPEVLRGIADQDYPNVQSLFFVLDDGDASAIATRIREVLPNAVVRTVEGNPGWGPVQNQVLRLVEGDAGFFCFLHDDVALEPSTVSRLIEETFRSNAGLVGPKLVDWADPRVLREVGVGVDRIGERVSAIEPGEIDQEQHDAVRDVFTLSSACLLVRADLFRELQGFSPEISFHGEDLDMSWRVHLSGARVLIVPGARARHIGRLALRNPELDSLVEVERHRVLTVLSLTGAMRLPVVYAHMLVESVARVAVATVGGGLRDALASLRATLAAPTWIRQIRTRRSRVTRRVPSAEIADLQERTSVRLAAFLRRRRIVRPARTTDDVNPRHTRFVLGVGSALVLFLLAGSRSWIMGDVAVVGEFLPLRAGERPFTLLAEYFGGWWRAGFGQTTSNPTGLLVTAVAGLVTFGQLGLLRLLSIVGLVVVGWFGMWKMTGREFGMRARIIAVLLYGAMPSLFAALGEGRWSLLIVYASLPWWGRALVRGEEPLVGAKRTQALAVSVVLVAIALAFEPSTLVIFAWVAAWWAVANLIGGLGWRGFASPVRVLAVAAVGGFVLNLPSAIHLFERPVAFAGPLAANDRGLGLLALASFDFDARVIGAFSVAIHVLPLASILLTRGRHALWATRSVVLAVPTMAVMFLVDRDLIDVSIPSNHALSFVVAFAAAIAVLALLGTALDRTPARSRTTIIACTTVGLLGLLPSVPYFTSGNWGQPETTLAQLLTQLPTNPVVGDYHVAYVGDGSLLPLDSTVFADGLGYAVSDDGELTLADRWTPPTNEATEWLEQTLRLVESGSTVRAGRLLTPLAIRYVVVPLSDVDADASTVSPRATAFVAALANQLDMRRTYYSASLVIYENVSWIPTLARLSSESAVLSSQAGSDALLTVDLESRTVLKIGDGLTGDPTFIEKGTVHFAAPHSNDVVLNVGGIDVQSRVAFGGTMAFDSPVDGLARLELRTPWLHILTVLVQIALWLLAVLAIGDLGRFKRRSLMRTSREVTLLDDDRSVLKMGGEADVT